MFSLSGAGTARGGPHTVYEGLVTVPARAAGVPLAGGLRGLLPQPRVAHLQAKLGARDRVQLVITAYQAALFDT